MNVWPSHCVRVMPLPLPLLFNCCWSSTIGLARMTSPGFDATSQFVAVPSRKSTSDVSVKQAAATAAPSAKSCVAVAPSLTRIAVNVCVS